MARMIHCKGSTQKHVQHVAENGKVMFQIVKICNNLDINVDDTGVSADKDMMLAKQLLKRVHLKVHCCQMARRIDGNLVSALGIRIEQLDSFQLEKLHHIIEQLYNVRVERSMRFV